MISVTTTVTEYLDDNYGEEKLFGTDPMRRALQKLLVQDFEKKVNRGTNNSLLTACYSS